MPMLSSRTIRFTLYLFVTRFHLHCFCSRMYTFDANTCTVDALSFFPCFDSNWKIANSVRYNFFSVFILPTQTDQIKRHELRTSLTHWLFASKSLLKLWLAFLAHSLTQYYVCLRACNIQHVYPYMDICILRIRIAVDSMRFSLFFFSIGIWAKFADCSIPANFVSIKVSNQIHSPSFFSTYLYMRICSRD